MFDVVLLYGNRLIGNGHLMLSQRPSLTKHRSRSPVSDMFVVN